MAVRQEAPRETPDQVATYAIFPPRYGIGQDAEFRSAIKVALHSKFTGITIVEASRGPQGKSIMTPKPMDPFDIERLKHANPDDIADTLQAMFQNKEAILFTK